MKIRILESAYQDLINGYWFYEKQSERLVIIILDILFSDIDSLQLYAGIHPILYKKYHRLLSKRFPYAIYYQIKDKTVLIYAVIHCHRDPSFIGKKLNK